jgi:hypothetical protein
MTRDLEASRGRKSRCPIFVRCPILMRIGQRGAVAAFLAVIVREGGRSGIPEAATKMEKPRRTGCPAFAEHDTET